MADEKQKVLAKVDIEHRMGDSSFKDSEFQV